MELFKAGLTPETMCKTHLEIEPCRMCEEDRYREALHKMLKERYVDTSEAIVGYRAWWVFRPNYLSCINQKYIWEPMKVMEAECWKKRATHFAPVEDCECGIYASRRPLTQTSHRACAIGEVYLWGNIWEHEYGYRAQYAYPKKIYIINKGLEDIAEWIGHCYGVQSIYHGGWVTAHQEMLDDFKEIYGVDEKNVGTLTQQMKEKDGFFKRLKGR